MNARPVGKRSSNFCRGSPDPTAQLSLFQKAANLSTSGVVLREGSELHAHDLPVRTDARANLYELDRVALVAVEREANTAGSPANSSQRACPSPGSPERLGFPVTPSIGYSTANPLGSLAEGRGRRP
jgi:hypothetical protein